MPTDASQDAIDAAWKRLVRAHHPDRAADTDRAAATRRTSAINEAYQTLSDPQRRARYDRRMTTTGRSTIGGTTQGPDAYGTIDAFLRLRRQRLHERWRVSAAGAVGVAAVLYSLRVLKVL